MTLTEAINLAKQGRSAGWGTIINSTYSKKRFITSKYLKASLNTVLHKSYVKALSSIKLLNDPEIFPSWLGIIIAGMSAIELPKKNKISFSENGLYESETWYSDVNESLDSIPKSIDFTKNEVMEISKKLLYSIKLEHRMCLIYYYIEGFSVKEISRALQCSETAVISFLNTGIKKADAIFEGLKESYKNVSEFSSSIQLLIYILEAEYSYIKDTEVPKEMFNKIIEDTAAIVAESYYSADISSADKPKNNDSEEYDNDDENEEDEKKSSLFSKNKKIIILIIVIIAIIAGLTIHFAGKEKSPDTPSDKPSESDTVSDLQPSSDTEAEENSSEEASEENSSEDSSDNAAPVINQTPNSSSSGNQPSYNGASSYTPSQNQGASPSQSGNQNSNSGTQQKPNTPQQPASQNPPSTAPQPSDQPTQEQTTAPTVTEPAPESPSEEPETPSDNPQTPDTPNTDDDNQDAQAIE